MVNPSYETNYLNQPKPYFNISSQGFSSGAGSLTMPP